MIIINSEKEMEKYFDENANAYIFEDDLVLNFRYNSKTAIVCHNLYAEHLDAGNIDARNIYTSHITASEIEAWNFYSSFALVDSIKVLHNIVGEYISSEKIRYGSLCYSDRVLKCDDVQGRYDNSIALVLKEDLVAKYINGGKDEVE